MENVLIEPYAPGDSYQPSYDARASALSTAVSSSINSSASGAALHHVRRPSMILYLIAAARYADQRDGRTGASTDIVVKTLGSAIVYGRP